MTPPVPQLIAGCGFAGMVWELAQHRTRRIIWPSKPKPRGQVYRWKRGPSSEYYRLCDIAANAFDAHMQVGEYGKHYAFLPRIYL